MITDHEYPATHSMFTSWYAVDDEGNVAMIYMEDNGPVPQLCPEGNSIVEMLTTYQNEIHEDIVDAQFTETQADILINTLNLVTKDTSPDDLKLEQVFQIEPNGVDIFFEIIRKYREDCDSPIICLNKSKNLFFIDFLYDNGARELYESGIVIKHRQQNISGIFDLQEYEKNFKRWPYYIYYQDYNSALPAVRAFVPELPIKSNQISEIAVKSAIHVRGNFDKTKEIQLCALFPFKTYDILPKENAGYLLPDGNGRQIVLSSNTFPESWIGTSNDPTISDFAIWQGSDEPRCLLLNSPLPSLDNTLLKVYKMGNTWTMWYFFSIVYGSSFKTKGDYNMSAKEKYDLDYYNVARAFNDVSHNVEEIVDFLQPWVIVSQIEILDILKTKFRISDGNICINNIQYPFYTDKEIKLMGYEVLKQYFDKPYRGQYMSRIRSVRKGDKA